MRWLWRRKWRVFALLAVLLPVFAVLDYNLYPILSKPGGISLNTGENGLWIKYTWYFGKWDDGDMDRLAARLKENQIRYAYFHVRSIKADGSLKYRNPENAKKLNSALHGKAQPVESIAWMYIGNKHGLGKVDLGNQAVRKTIIKESLWLIDKCGFDGVQIDYEICRSGDKGFLTFMQELRKSFPKDKLLSIDTPIRLRAPFLRWGGWSDEYYRKIAATCDQICVMGYDSVAYFPRAYVLLMRNQTVKVTQAVLEGNPKCRVIIGLPTYEDRTKSHNPHSENIRLALKGVREGLANRSLPKKSFAGVALFADYTTAQDEWETYRKLWPTLDQKKEK